MFGVGFDFDHTLGIDNKLERIAFLQLLDRVVERGGHALGTLVEETARIDALLASQRAGGCTIESAVRGFIQERGNTPTDDDVAWYRDFAVDLVDAVVIPLPGVREMLGALERSGIPIAILTNGWSPLQQRKAQRVGFRGPVVVSADIGVQKPDVRAFEALAQAMQLPLDSLWYVGDTPASDVAGALAAGMRAVWLDAENVPYPSDIPPPTRIIHGLNELSIGASVTR